MNFLKTAIVATLMLAVTGSTMTAAVAADSAATKTIVLVHGAWSDASSSWSAVIPKLVAKGFKVVAVQNPLSSLAADVDATNRVINQQSGPVVLVGRSWGGAVITQAGANAKVKALVYVAAFAPDEGQSVNDLLKGLPAPSWAPALIADERGFLTLPADVVKHSFAQDLTEAQAALIAATQQPFFGGCFDDKVTATPYRTKPTWYVLTEKDQMIAPQLQEAMSSHMKATVLRVSSSHVPMLSHPDAVVASIVAAAESAK